MKKRVVVAMSGGVDSSVTAAMLKERGYEVIGVTMQIWPDSLPASQSEGGCCSLSAVEDARRVASRLDIPYYVLNFADVFENQVIRYFCDEYKKARTPNPCIKCNQLIKFDLLLRKALQLEADYLATGHYARVVEFNGRYTLAKAKDQQKDQTYNLFTLTQEQLEHILFPLGDYTKPEVREIAAEIGLAVAKKPDSQEICFIPDNNYQQFLREYDGGHDRPGLIVDTKGRVLGRHQGLSYYTIGQRKGLGVSVGHPVYVVDLDAEKNLVVLGEKEENLASSLLADELNWMAVPDLQKPLRVKAKIRYRSPAAEAVLKPAAHGLVQVDFSEPQRAITPGQAVVFYQDDLLVGGGFIKKVLSGKK